jgi:hypothetical protein
MKVRFDRWSMRHSKERFSAMEIRDEVGVLADGGTIDQKYIDIIKAAVQGVVETADKGSQIFVVMIECANQHNVDTEELIWPRDPASNDKDSVPLEVIANPDLWEKAAAYWLEAAPLSWTAFVWRVAVPLADRLKIIGSWDKIRYGEQIDKLK